MRRFVIASLERDLAKDQIKRMEEALQRQDNKIIDLMALLTRAADALEDTLPMKQYASQFKLPYYDLIDELRKAAQ